MRSGAVRLRVLRLVALMACCLAVFVTPSRPAAPARCAEGYVALTFDDGPRPTTRALLRALERNRLRATMFNVGARASRHPELVRAEVDAGMRVENHTLTHRRLTRLDDTQLEAELSRTQDVLRGLTGRTPTLMRPPYLATDARVRAAAQRLGLLEVLASVNSRDSTGASAGEIAQATRRLKPGGIMLLHDGPEPTLRAVPRIAEILTERGLCTGRIARDQRTGRPVAVKP